MKLLTHCGVQAHSLQEKVPEGGKMDKDDLTDIVCIDVKKLLVKILN